MDMEPAENGVADVPETLRLQVDEVVGHLVSLRGGGHFLSSRDGRLLVRWLDSGVSVAVIAVALDRVAQRRRQRRSRTPLSLDACRGEVKKLEKERAIRVVAAPAVPAVVTLERATDPEGEALSALDALFAGPRSEEDPSALADAAMAVVRRFQERIWEASAQVRTALLAEAEAELQDMKALLEGDDWSRTVEEVARDRLRRRYPRLSASAVWDRLVAP